VGTRMSELEDFTISKHLARATRTAPYQLQRDDPLHRPLQVFTLDPAQSRLVGGTTTCRLPYEPLAPGPQGAIFEVVDEDRSAGCKYRGVDLDDSRVLIGGGLRPSVMDPFFHQQMVYAVAMKTYDAFRRAMGRDLHWGFDRGQDAEVRLRIHPHWENLKNAFYSKEMGAVCFGYYDAVDQSRIRGRNLPHGIVFTCLSHDIVAHEVTHAIVDGLRPHFACPTNNDMLALHEALADLVAVFQHFTYSEVVLTALERSRGKLSQAALLTDIATQFGHTIGLDGPLRSAIDSLRDTDTREPSSRREQRDKRLSTTLMTYDPGLQPHELGSVLMSAVFDAFNEIYLRKSRNLVQLAAGGKGVLPEGHFPVALQTLLAQEISSLAAHFQTICIRAIDYCPPVDVDFGDYLRALVTADYDLVQDDRWGYREAMIEAFSRRRIYPRDVPTLAEESLLWCPPERPIRRDARLSFEQIKFRGDPGRAVGWKELETHAYEVGKLVSNSEYADMFGLVPCPRAPAGDQRLQPPQVESVRTLRRVGPDGQVVFDLIAEVVQAHSIGTREGNRRTFLGGSTVIFGPDGNVRYAISKHVLSARRLAAQKEWWEIDRTNQFPCRPVTD
jgi:hypothetical protein